MQGLPFSYIGRNLFLKIFLLAALVILLQSCYKDLSYPKTTISEDKMVIILSDIHLAEAKIADYISMNVGIRDSIASVLYQRVFELNGIKGEDFNKNMEAYMKNPDALSKLYEKVLSRLQKEESANIIK